MKYFDISLPLQEGMVAWPGDTRFGREESRGKAIVSKIIMSSHTGTHIDAPKHFLFDRGGVDSIALEKLIGKCRVIEIKFSPVRSSISLLPEEGLGEVGEERSKRNQISVSDLKKFHIKAGDKILLKTRNSKLISRPQFTSNYVSLALNAAKYLAAKKISLVGIDYYGIEAKSAPGHPVHKTLLRAGIVILEGLDLSQIKPGDYRLAALPLRIKKADGSPARVILWK
jgi:arylformamidase